MFEEIRKELKEKSDKKLAEFNVKLCPGVNPEIVLGIKIPELRKIAKKIISKDCFDNYVKEYNKQNSKVYLEETIIYGLLIGYVKIDIENKFNYMKNYIPLIDNWLVNDTVCSTLKLKNINDKEKLWNFIDTYLKSKNQFEVRFAIIIILHNFLIDEYIDEVILKLDMIENDSYYVKMAIAWTLAEIGIKFNDKAMKYLKSENKLDIFTFNKTIQKMRESYRISKEQKDELKLMKKI